MFSNAVKIDNLNDYNKKSEECVKPFLYQVEVEQSQKLEKPNLIHIRKKNNNKNKKGRGEISLTDCLACSGCVTDEETTFLKSQNATEILNNVKNKKINVMSLSLQSVVALSVHFNLPLQVTQKKLCFLFKSLHFDYVFDSSLSELITLQEAKKEFLDFFCKNRETENEQQTVDKAISNTQKQRKVYLIRNPKKKLEKTNKEIHNKYSNEREGETYEENKHADYNVVERKHQMPLLCAHCSGSVIYGEKNFDQDLLNAFSRLKSNQEVQGVLLKLILLQNGVSTLNFLKKIYFNNFFKFCECKWNFAKVCENHFFKKCNLLKNGTKGEPSFSLSIYDINHVYLLYCFDKKIEAHKNYVQQQNVIEENIDSFLTISPFIKEQQNIQGKKQRIQEKGGGNKKVKKTEMEGKMEGKMEVGMNMEMGMEETEAEAERENEKKKKKQIKKINWGIQKKTKRKNSFIW